MRYVLKVPMASLFLLFLGLLLGSSAGAALLGKQHMLFRATARRGPPLQAVVMGATVPPKIVVTGIGVVSSVGDSNNNFWENIVNGKSGVGPITAFDASRFPTTIGGECSHFDPKPWFDNKKTVRSVDRYTHLAMAASRMAVEDSALSMTLHCTLYIDSGVCASGRSNHLVSLETRLRRHRCC